MQFEKGHLRRKNRPIEENKFIKAQTRPKTGQTWTNKNKQEGKHNLIHPIKLFFNQNFSKMGFSSNFEHLQWNRTVTIQDFDLVWSFASYLPIFDDGYDPNEDPYFENMDVDTDESVTMILMTILSLMTSLIKIQLSV